MSIANRLLRYSEACKDLAIEASSILIDDNEKNHYIGAILSDIWFLLKDIELELNVTIDALETSYGREYSEIPE